MGESPLEEFEAHEHAQHAQHAAHGGDSLISRVTFTIAVLAVLAAVAASLETTEGDGAIVTKNEAVLEQNQASDTWAFYQAKSLKKNLYTIAAEQGGPRAEAYAKEAARNGAEQGAIQAKAKAFEAERDHKSQEAEVHERRHGRLTIASTLLHMAIAIATLSIILRKPWPWLVSLGLTAAGLGLAAWAYL